MLNDSFNNFLRRHFVTRRDLLEDAHRFGQLVRVGAIVIGHRLCLAVAYHVDLEVRYEILRHGIRRSDHYFIYILTSEHAEDSFVKIHYGVVVPFVFIYHRVCVQAYYEEVALGLGRLEEVQVADVKQIKRSSNVNDFITRLFKN